MAAFARTPSRQRFARRSRRGLLLFSASLALLGMSVVLTVMVQYAAEQRLTNIANASFSRVKEYSTLLWGSCNQASCSQPMAALPRAAQVNDQVAPHVPLQGKHMTMYWDNSLGVETLNVDWGDMPAPAALRFIVLLREWSGDPALDSVPAPTTWRMRRDSFPQPVSELVLRIPRPGPPPGTTAGNPWRRLAVTHAETFVPLRFSGTPADRIIDFRLPTSTWAPPGTYVPMRTWPPVPGMSPPVHVPRVEGNVVAATGTHTADLDLYLTGLRATGNDNETDTVSGDSGLRLTSNNTGNARVETTRLQVTGQGGPGRTVLSRGLDIKRSLNVHGGQLTVNGTASAASGAGDAAAVNLTVQSGGDLNLAPHDIEATYVCGLSRCGAADAVMHVSSQLRAESLGTARADSRHPGFGGGDADLVIQNLNATSAEFWTGDLCSGDSDQISAVTTCSQVPP